MSFFRFPLVLLAACLGVCASAETVSIFDGGEPTNASNAIDRAVFSRLAQLGIQPARLCSDEVFVRRAFLDTIGTLPKASEVTAFLASISPGKRGALIETLLARQEFAPYWAMKWSDILRLKSEYPINLWPNASQAYHRWLIASLQENRPYDLFARELLASNGSNFRVGPVNFYRAVQSREPATLARTVALTFMGARAERWPKDRLADLAVFFSCINTKATEEWKEEIVFFDPSRLTAAPRDVTLPDGSKATLSSDRDPREVFASWLIRPDNPAFTGPIVNRVWSWLLGRGVVHEADDFRADNPPSNPELLAALQHELVASRFDLKALFRAILNSQTYQLSCVPRSDKPGAAENFAYYPLRRLEAEVLIDAINQVTGGAEKYSSAIPEPFTYIPADVRSIALPDGSITSSFLEMFGRPPRDTGLESERNNRVTATQRLHLLNSSQIQRKIERGARLQTLFRAAPLKPVETVETLYLTILSRPPTTAEREAISQYSRSSQLSPSQTAIDLTWALMNTAEFLYRH